VTAAEFDYLNTTGTPSATTFLRGDKAWAAAGSTDAGDLDTGTLPAARLPAGVVIKTYYNELLTTTTIAPDEWRDILSVTTSVPLSTSNDFLIHFMVHYGVDDWGPVLRVYNSTTTTPIGVATGGLGSNRVAGTATDTAGSSGGDYSVTSYIHAINGVVRQSGCTLVAQTFKAQLWSGRDTLSINKHLATNDDDITGLRTICSIMVQEIAG
jgi:hypothetical protein